MTIIEDRKEHNGVTYDNIRSTNLADCESCLGDTKRLIQGKPKITIMKGSWKYGKQIQFSCTALKGEVIERQRNPSEWDTIEILMEFEEGKELIKQAYLELFEK